MLSFRRSSITASLLSATVILCAGCGLTRSTDTTRTATEQLLISDAIDRAVQNMNLQPLAGQTIFLDESKVTDAVDKNYLLSTLRQQLLANRCELKEKREDADFVVEARAGAIGTDRSDLLFGIPNTPVPAIPLVQPLPSTIPEVPIAKRKDQRGVAKIAIFAYHRATGTPVWQSGIVREESSANDIWILGAGPFQRGTIYEEQSNVVKNALKGEPSKQALDAVLPSRDLGIAKETLFTPPEKLVKRSPPASQPVVQAVHQEPVVAVKPAAPATAPAAAPVPPTAVQTASTAASKAVSATASQPAAQPPAPPAANPAATAAAIPIPKPANAPSSSYAGDNGALPQPRFNSPQ